MKTVKLFRSDLELCGLFKCARTIKGQGSALKDYIIRIYDASGEGAKAEMLFGFQVKDAYEAVSMEKKLDILRTRGNKLNLSLRPFDIRTVRMKRS